MPIKTLTKTSPKMSVKTRAKTSIRKLTRTPSGIITVTLTKTTSQAPPKARRPSGAKMTAQAPSKARRPSGAKMTAQAPSKARRPSGATVTLTKSGGFRLRAYGPDAPDLRTVVPELLKGRGELDPDDDEECRTCLGNLRIRDGKTGDLRRCLDCGGTGASS